MEFNIKNIPKEYLEMSHEELKKEKERMFQEIKSQPKGPEKKKYTGKIRFDL